MLAEIFVLKIKYTKVQYSISIQIQVYTSWLKFDVFKPPKAIDATTSESYSAYLSHGLGTKNLGKELADF